MFVSKIVTFNKVNFLNNLSNEHAFSKGYQKEYFNIGHPIDSPPTLRGSMVVELNVNFIFDNKDFFEYGSPIDIGSLMAGYINPHNFEISETKMDFFTFSRLIKDLLNVDYSDKHLLLKHQITESVHEILKLYLRNEVADFVMYDSNPHSRLFEFCLSGNYVLDSRHVKIIHIPNTYTNSNLIKKISSRFKGKVMTFNPKYGFEGRYVA
ncbi:hypothetical protein [Vibrio maritimus]|uniref:hypothetical protein n=1 Tax=Vibrio maritimus TaxID=990268 RepID=UPI001F15B477|nr:hypothetical protein [Vibrio maritimus]